MTSPLEPEPALSAPSRLNEGLPDYLTVNEVARAARLKPKTIRNRVYRKPAVRPYATRVGGRLLFERSEVISWLRGEG